MRSNVCVVDHVTETDERHDEGGLVHVECVVDRLLGLIVCLGVDVGDQGNQERPRKQS